MLTEPIFVFGSSGHAKVVIDILECEGRSIIGLLDDFRTPGERIAGHEILGTFEDIATLVKRHRTRAGVVAVGDNWQRAQASLRVCESVDGFEFVTAVHPAATIARSAHLGPGTVVMAGAVINSDVVLGKGCIVNTSASIDHDCVLQPFASLAPGARLGGAVTLGECSAVLIGASVTHNAKVGHHSVVGGGSMVLGDVADLQLVAGIPARSLRPRVKGEKYL